MNLNAKFITIEGIEGVGKSTLLQTVHQLLIEAKIEHVLTREPGGTQMAERIRELLLSPYGEPVTDTTELLLMFAARSQHIEQFIKPHLAGNQWVVSDRFTDASFAYQGGGRQLDLQKITTLADWVEDGLQPDLTLLLDAPADIALSRAKKRSAPDRIENEDLEFFERVRAAYLTRAAHFTDRFTVIDATQSLEQVKLAVAWALEPLIKGSS